jgi:hypothetical protein
VARFVALVIVIVVVVAVGATLKVEERCGGVTTVPDPFVPSTRSSGSTCDWRIVWRY